MATVKSCHLVGSVPLADAETVFRTCTEGMLERLKRIPDGETEIRSQFIYFQSFMWPKEIVSDFRFNKLAEVREYTKEDYEEGLRLLEQADLRTGYDDAAINSYEIFKNLKQDGMLPKDIKFQVSLPTLGNIVGVFVQKAFQPRAEGLYEASLFEAMRNIQAKIPHEELAIQLDIAVDTLYVEGAVDHPMVVEQRSRRGIYCSDGEPGREGC